MNTLTARIKRAEFHALIQANSAHINGDRAAFVYWLMKRGELRRGIVSGYIGRN